MTEQNYKTARENYTQHCIDSDCAAISPRVNPTGRLYKKLIKEIQNKYER